MTAPISEIVQVNISRESINISRVGFGTPLILGGALNSTARVAYFQSLSALAAALLGGTNAPEYKAAQAVFAANPKVLQVGIGHRGSAVTARDNDGTMTGGSIGATVNGEDVSQTFTTDKATTMNALAVKIAAVVGIATCSWSGGSHQFTITQESGTVIGIDFDTSAVVGTLQDSEYTFTITESEDVDVALNACMEENNNWYGLIVTSRTAGVQIAAAAWVEATELKFFVTASDDTDIVDETLSGDTTSIAYTFHSRAYLKTALIYSAFAATEYPDAALLGKLLPLDPGSYTAAFKTLAGITVDNLTPTQRQNAFDKLVNVYEYVGGVNILRQGTVSDNEYIDVMIFIDWLTARCREAVYQVLVSLPKVPYTDAGINGIYNALTSPLKTGQNVGGISPTAYDDQKKQIGGFYITVPRLQDVPLVDKTARELHNVKFVAFLAGAIHKVFIDGTVTL